MAKNNSTSRRRPKKPRPATTGPRESQASDAATVAWTVAVTMVVACDIAAIAAHWYALRNPPAHGAALFGNLMLVGGAVVGVVVLALFPVVYRLRRTPPPMGFAVFAACAAAAPLLALAARASQ